MKSWKKMLATVVAGVLSLSLLSGCKEDKKAESASWPSQPVTIITPWAVGGLADQIARAMTEYGKEQYGQPLLADNILGSGGAVALTEYLKEKPNTHKLILGGEGSFAIAPLSMKVAYKFEDYVPIINIYSSTFVLLANPKVGVASFDDLQKLIATDKTVKIATNGTASSEAMQVAALFTEMEGKFKIIPYEGANEALTAVVSGEVDFAVTHASLAREFVKAGNVNPVVAFNEKRLVDDVYNLDSVVEHGYDTWMTNICAVFIRAGTDQAIIDKNYTALKAILENPKLQATAKNIGLTLDIKDGAAVKAYIDSTIAKAEKYSKLVK
ncbi:tripartite tricarboxylate transporter substrate binding protein [Lonepinella koalarum]|uniref:Tripartite-type tricarboxylate transporter receptor subunit TctC n=1 Tax=Lonepinella koalarum TaxID=53417 RepID=A0A4R1L0Y4_9PAST|nr:tripartite tricarboxylate transporter substrate binding protein [Lonepinella koalarum]MDH2926692.1 tricarboxylate transporter [Lonepinella koalarum]TCK70647.1 tripartite-type tricarboxylate transporter receptor subunit TctC [Lonepinella koalarum]